MDYVVRKATKADVEVVVGWALNLGWNPGELDVDNFLSDGFFVGELWGNVVGGCSVMVYPNGYAFLGLYIVTEEHRGKGYGLPIFRAAMQHAAGCKNIGLDAVAERVGTYEVSGFRVAYRQLRHEGVSSSQPQITPHLADSLKMVKVSEVPEQELLRYDTSVFGTDRGEMLKQWLARPNVHAFGILSGDSSLCGFCAIRSAAKGYRVGPLFADSEEIANVLLQGLTASIPPGSVWFLDIPDACGAGVNLAAKWGLKHVFTCVRMYTNPETAGEAVEKVFGTTALEIG